MLNNQYFKDFQNLVFNNSDFKDFQNLLLLSAFFAAITLHIFMRFILFPWDNFVNNYSLKELTDIQSGGISLFLTFLFLIPAIYGAMGKRYLRVQNKDFLLHNLVCDYKYTALEYIFIVIAFFMLFPVFIFVKHII